MLLQSAIEAPAGTFPVVLAAGDCGILLHEAIGHGLEADFNRKKTSNYTDRIGQVVASSLCTVVDDGTIRDSRGSINVDDEGNLPGYNVLIENGILRGYMQDRMSTKHFGVQPTGNGRRQSFRHYPMPRMTNTYMLAGQTSRRISSDRSTAGIYCVSFSGGQVNISNGDFVFSVTEGYMIEDGKVTAPIRNVNLIGNGPGRAAQGDGRRQRLRAERRALDLRQGRAIGAGRRRHPDGADQRHHRRRNGNGLGMRGRDGRS